MSNKFFNQEISQDYPYLLVSVYHKDCDNCGTYYKGEDGEYITSILTGEKFYSLYDFVFSIKGLGTDDEWSSSFFYNEECGEWIPLMYL
jgi:hypothetical protein